MTKIINSDQSYSGLVEKYIGTAYDNVKYVADNMEYVIAIGQIEDIENIAEIAGGVAEDAEAAAASAAAAAVSETNAATSASSAGISAGNAEDSAAAAAISEVNAGDSADFAEASKNAAAISEGNAATSATNAGISEDNAEDSFTNFDARYLGAKSSAPSVDNEGNALVEGAMYWDVPTNSLKFWDGTSWVAMVSAGITYAGVWDPSAGQEYPATPVDDVFYIADNDTPYLYTAGDLAGQTVNAGDYITYVLVDTQWQLAGGVVDTTILLHADGSVASIAPQKFQDGAGANEMQLGNADLVFNPVTGFVFKSGNAVGEEGLFMTDPGLVGINKAVPVVALDVVGKAVIAEPTGDATAEIEAEDGVSKAELILTGAVPGALTSDVDGVTLSQANASVKLTPEGSPDNGEVVISSQTGEGAGTNDALVIQNWNGSSYDELFSLNSDGDLVVSGTIQGASEGGVAASFETGIFTGSLNLAKIATVTLDAQGEGCSVRLAIIGSGHAGNAVYQANINFGVKQDAALGSDPVISSILHSTIGFGKTSVAYKIISNTGPVVVELYVAIPAVNAKVTGYVILSDNPNKIEYTSGDSGSVIVDPVYATTPVFVTTDAAFIGIGTDTPTHQLEVAGEVRINTFDDDDNPGTANIALSILPDGNTIPSGLGSWQANPFLSLVAPATQGNRETYIGAGEGNSWIDTDNVIIGAPSGSEVEKLEVKGNVAATGGFLAQDNREEEIGWFMYEMRPPGSVEPSGMGHLNGDADFSLSTVDASRTIRLAPSRGSYIEAESLWMSTSQGVNVRAQGAQWVLTASPEGADANRSGFWSNALGGIEFYLYDEFALDAQSIALTPNSRSYFAGPDAQLGIGVAETNRITFPEKLHVAGDARITGDLTVEGNINGSGGGSEWNVVTGGINYNKGNVGIGPLSVIPDAPLDVTSTIRARETPETRYKNGRILDAVSDMSNSSIGVTPTQSAQNFEIGCCSWGGVTYINGGAIHRPGESPAAPLKAHDTHFPTQIYLQSGIGSIQFRVSESTVLAGEVTSTTRAMTINNKGNVGIGESSDAEDPTDKLFVDGDIHLTGQVIEGDIGLVVFNSIHDSVHTIPNAITIYGQLGSTADISFYVKGAKANTEVKIDFFSNGGWGGLVSANPNKHYLTDDNGNAFITFRIGSSLDTLGYPDNGVNRLPVPAVGSSIEGTMRVRVLDRKDVEHPFEQTCAYGNLGSVDEEEVLIFQNVSASYYNTIMIHSSVPQVETLVFMARNIEPDSNISLRFWVDGAPGPMANPGYPQLLWKTDSNGNALCSMSTYNKNLHPDGGTLPEDSTPTVLNIGEVEIFYISASGASLSQKQDVSYWA